jgi:hypothetical protein
MMFQMPRFMKTGLSVAAISLAVVGCAEQPTSNGAAEQGKPSADADQQVQAAVDQITEAYLSIQSQLASDSIDQVSAQLQAIRDSANSLKRHASQTNDSTLNTKGAAIAKAADFDVMDVKQTRDKFVSVSGSVIDLVQAHPPSDETVSDLYVAECPMVEDGLWLQTTENITNPYMGSRMLQCGSIQRAVKGDYNAGDGADS